MLQYSPLSWWWQTTDPNDVLACVLLTSILLLSISSLYLNMKSKTRRPPLPPGPMGLPIIGNIPFLGSELHTQFASLAQTHGPIITLHLGTKVGIIISSPSLACEVLKDHDVTFANRDISVAEKEVAYGGFDIVWGQYGPEWRMLRKVCVSQMLSKAALDSVYEFRRREVRQTVKYFYERVGLPVDIGEHMFFTLSNVITSMLWGGTVKGEEKGSIATEFRQAVSQMSEIVGKPNLSDYFPGLARFDLQGIEKRMKGLVKQFDRIFQAMIDQGLKMKGEGMEDSNKDFLQFLLKLKDEGDPKAPLTTTHIKALLMDIFAAGTETTSNTVEFALAEMMNKPEVMKKAQKELETIIGKDGIVEESHIPKLPYLYAVMKETLRLHPVLPLLVPHCASDSCIVGGYTIPKGARIFINVWAIHRDPSIWKNPLEFDPERFLDSKWDYSGNDFSYFPFGSGRRICVGNAMAERMFMFSVATFVHSFDWKLAEGEKLDVSEKFGFVLKKKIPLIVIPKARLSDPAQYD